MEFNRYVQQELRQSSTNLPQQEQLAAIRTLSGEADKHMKQWVSQK
jgi:hypothetical protein